MKLKNRLLLLSGVLTVLLVLLSASFLSVVGQTLSGLNATLWWFIALAVMVQLVGHWLRMLRTKIVTDQVKVGSQQDQFGALAVGYLFNTLLPLRAGELLRALFIAVRLRISFLYTFSAIVLERAIDLLFIGCIVIILAIFFNSQVAVTVAIAATGVIIFALLTIGVFALLIRENKFLLSLIWRMTNWLNESLRNNLRFKVWSLIFGLQQFMRRKGALRRYAWLTVLSWVCYVTSMVVLALAILPNLTPSRTIVAATAPYVGVSAPSGPAYIASYDGVLHPVVSSAAGDTAQTATFVVLSWLILTAPMFFIGFVTLLLFNGKILKRSPFATQAAFANKLLRQEDISQAFPAFLDSYFSGNKLAKILHKLESAGELSLVKFFKGGSDAITILVLSKEKLFVKKIIPLEHEDRLKAQYDWLVKHQNLSYVVRVLGEQRTDEYYAIDLAYDPENIPFFEYIHHNSLPQSIEVLEKSWKYLYKHIHANAKEAKLYPKDRQAYIDKHIFDCVDKAVAAHAELKRAVEPDRLVINGEEYDNLYQIMDKIKKCKPAWQDIATYRRSGVVFGDIAIDNILVAPSTARPLLIDPAPDGNIIEGPVFDLGKLAQSFYCGYEFLFRDDDPVHLNQDGSINYREQRSAKYTHMWKHIHTKLAPQYVTEAEQRALIFHAAALHLRRLKHQVLFNPDNVLKFYAVGVKTLNDFLAQYTK